MNHPATALLDEADACHDDDPARAADLLRRIDPAALPAERRTGLAFLLNHVIGEKLGGWHEAHAMFDRLLRAAGDQPPPALWRQAAAAARLAGDAVAAQRLSDALAAAAGASAAQAQDVVALTAAMYSAPGLPSAQAADEAGVALRALEAEAWQAAGPLDGAAAACANNIASGLLERPAADLHGAPLRDVLERAARLGERFWLRAGTWVNHERAAYLRAMVANALGDASQARAHALRALAIVDENDTDRTEQVDRAFIELERARACRDLALPDEARTAQDTADALAAKFNDAGLDAWFAKRRSELGTPTGRVA